MSFLSVAHYFSQHYIRLHLLYTSGGFVLNDWILDGIVSNDWKDDEATGILKDFQIAPKTFQESALVKWNFTHTNSPGPGVYKKTAYVIVSMVKD